MISSISSGAKERTTSFPFSGMTGMGNGSATGPGWNSWGGGAGSSRDASFSTLSRKSRSSLASGASIELWNSSRVLSTRSSRSRYGLFRGVGFGSRAAVTSKTGFEKNPNHPPRRCCFDERIIASAPSSALTMRKASDMSFALNVLTCIENHHS